MTAIAESTEPVHGTDQNSHTPAAGSGEVVAPSTTTRNLPAPPARRRQTKIVDDLARKEHWLAEWSTRFCSRRELTDEEAYLAEDPSDPYHRIIRGPGRP